MKNNNDNTLEKFFDFYEEKMPAELHMVRTDKYEPMMEAVNNLSKSIKDEYPETEIKITHVEALPSLLALGIEGDEIIIPKAKALCETLKYAQNLEIYPKTNKKIQINILLADAYRPAEKEDIPPQLDEFF